jgi:hypothetical protein
MDNRCNNSLLSNLYNNSLLSNLYSSLRLNPLNNKTLKTHLQHHLNKHGIQKLATRPQSNIILQNKMLMLQMSKYLIDQLLHMNQLNHQLVTLNLLMSLNPQMLMN